MEKIRLINERLYLRSPSINVCFRVIIKGILEKNAIGKALETVCIVHPFLNSFVEFDNNAWLVKRNSPISVDYYNANEMDWEKWYKEADNIPFDFSKGPLVKFCVIFGENMEIVILGHHIIGDGIGYLNLVKDFLLALDNRLETTPRFLPDNNNFKKTKNLGFLAKTYARKLNKEWRKNRIHYSEDDFFNFFNEYRKKYVPNLYMASIEGENLESLILKSKSNNFTVNDIIASAFSIALMEFLNKKEIRLGVAANIRNELVSEPKKCMGNFVTGISAKVYYDSAKNFISNGKAIAGIIKDQLTNIYNRHLPIHFLNEFDKDFIESTMFSAYGNFDHSALKKLAELIGENLVNKGLGISNLGRHDFGNYNNFSVLNVQFIGPAFPANLLTVGAITVNDKLNLCLRYNEGELKTDSIKSICNRALEMLL